MHEKRFSGGIERLRSQERVERLELPRVIQLCLEGEKYNSVLDVGTGSGLFAEGFAEKGLRVAGIDASFEMLLAARGYVPGSRFTQALAEALPFRRGSFDLIFYGLVVHEANDPLAVLQAARRLSRGGVCILEWLYQEEEFGPPLAHRLNPTQIADLLQKAGFAHLESIPLTYLVLYRLTV